MSSNKFLKIADNIVAEEKEVFDILMDFEKTRKIRTKTRMNFTIDKSAASKFKKYCKDKGYNMSAKIEQSMRDIVRK